MMKTRPIAIKTGGNGIDYCNSPRLQKRENESSVLLPVYGFSITRRSRYSKLIRTVPPYQSIASSLHLTSLIIRTPGGRCRIIIIVQLFQGFESKMLKCPPIPSSSESSIMDKWYDTRFWVSCHLSFVIYSCQLTICHLLAWTSVLRLPPRGNFGRMSVCRFYHVCLSSLPWVSHWILRVGTLVCTIVVSTSTPMQERSLFGSNFSAITATLVSTSC